LGKIDENGYLTFMGRVGEEITLRSGEKVYTADIENSICERKEVVECAVIAFESKERG